MELICRICLQDTHRDQYRSINEKNTKSSSITLKQRLKICVPEIKLEVTNDPIICIKCYDDLQQAYDFKKKCLQTEEKVKCHMKKMKYRTCFKISEIANSGKEVVDLTNEESKVRVGNGGATIEFVDLSSITGQASKNDNSKRSMDQLNDSDSAKRLRLDEGESILPDKPTLPIIVEAKSLAEDPSESILPITLTNPLTIPKTPKQTTKSKKTLIVYDKDSDNPDNFEPPKIEPVTIIDEENGGQEFLNEDDDTNVSGSVHSDVGSHFSEQNQHVSENSNSHDFSHVCTVCGLQSSTMEEMKAHQQTVHSHLICVPCDRIFKNSSGFKKHSVVHETNRTKPYKCPHCNKNYATKGTFRGHVKNYHKILMTDADLEACMVSHGMEEDVGDNPSMNVETFFLPPIKNDVDDIPEDEPNFIDISELQQFQVE